MQGHTILQVEIQFMNRKCEKVISQAFSDWQLLGIVQVLGNQNAQQLSSDCFQGKH